MSVEKGCDPATWEAATGGEVTDSSGGVEDEGCVPA